MMIRENADIVYSKKNEVLDAMIVRHYGRSDSALLIAVLKANTHLADVLIDGRVPDYKAITMPAIVTKPKVEVVKLWQ